LLDFQGFFAAFGIIVSIAGAIAMWYTIYGVHVCGVRCTVSGEGGATMRVMAIDYGDRRIGIAVSDALCMLCGDAFILQEWNMDRAAQRIADEVRVRGVGTLVLGLPRNMDGSEGPRAEKSREFAALLQRETGLIPVLWDERRSSVEAHAILHANGRKMKQHRSSVDAVAASLMLESYLSGHAR